MPSPKAGTRGGPAGSVIPISPVDDQKKIKILDAFDEYSEVGTVSNEDKEEFWEWLLECLATYRGQIETGLPSTQGERKKRIEKVIELARKLETELGKHDDYNTYRTISEMLSIDDGNMHDLEHNLFKLRNLSPNETYYLLDEDGKNLTDKDGNELVHHINDSIKADPYLFDLMKKILHRWYLITNRVPGIGGGDDIGPKTGPVFRWLEDILALIGKTPPRDAFKEIKDQIKAHDTRDD